MIDHSGYHRFVVMNSQLKLITTLVQTWGSWAIGTPTCNSSNMCDAMCLCLLKETNQPGRVRSNQLPHLHSRHINDKRLGAKSRAEILRQQILRGSQESGYGLTTLGIIIRCRPVDQPDSTSGGYRWGWSTIGYQHWLNNSMDINGYLIHLDFLISTRTQQPSAISANKNHFCQELNMADSQTAMETLGFCLTQQSWPLQILVTSACDPIFLVFIVDQFSMPLLENPG